jgi:hypothetical protein
MHHNVSNTDSVFAIVGQLANWQQNQRPRTAVRRACPQAPAEVKSTETCQPDVSMRLSASAQSNVVEGNDTNCSKHEAELDG